MEEIQFYLDETREAMSNVIEHTVVAFSKIRAGKAMPSMVDGIYVNYYGAKSPLSQVASINTTDARTLVIKPWEKQLISEIEKAIMNSDLGITPQNDGDLIRLTVPALTEERRRDLTKQAKQEAESSKISIRNARKDTNDALKKLQKDGAPEDTIKVAETKVQALTDEFIKKIDELFSAKEVEIMKV